MIAALVLDIAAESMAMQAYLEGHRRDPDDELLYEDLCKARAQLKLAWLEHTAKLPAAA